MPLKPGAENIGANIAAEEGAGKSHRQAVAIALTEARRTDPGHAPPPPRNPPPPIPKETAMDPDANYQEQERLFGSTDPDDKRRVKELVAAMKEWVGNGGFKPAGYVGPAWAFGKDKPKTMTQAEARKLGAEGGVSAFNNLVNFGSPLFEIKGFDIAGGAEESSVADKIPGNLRGAYADSYAKAWREEIEKAEKKQGELDAMYEAGSLADKADPVESWKVVYDKTGHHRAVRNTHKLAAGETEMGHRGTYLEISKIADDLNTAQADAADKPKAGRAMTEARAKSLGARDGKDAVDEVLDEHGRDAVLAVPDWIDADGRVAEMRLARKVPDGLRDAYFDAYRESARERVEKIRGTPKTTSLAKDLADIVADKYRRLIEDLKASETGDDPFGTKRRTIEEDRRELVTALKNLNVALGCALPKPCKVSAAAQAGVIKNVTHLSIPALEKNEREWREFSSKED